MSCAAVVKGPAVAPETSHPAATWWSGACLQAFECNNQRVSGVDTAEHEQQQSSSNPRRQLVCIENIARIQCQNCYIGLEMERSRFLQLLYLLHANTCCSSKCRSILSCWYNRLSASTCCCHTTTLCVLSQRRLRLVGCLCQC